MISGQDFCKETMGGFYLIFYVLIVLSFSRAKIFWRWEKKKLDAIPMQTTPIKKSEDCFTICIFKEGCMSFNVHNDMCDIFDKDRCSPGVSLVDDVDTTYFDSITDDQCPLTTTQPQTTTTQQKQQSKLISAFQC